MMWEKHIALFVSENLPGLERETLDRIVLFGNEVLKWNGAINLISRRNTELILTRLIIEALFLLKILRGNESILDIGAGGGFPGVPLLLCSQVKIVMAESKSKRAAFLNHIVHLLNLKHAYVLRETIRTSSIHDLGKFDALWAKAALPLEALFSLGREGLFPGGTLILFRPFQGKREKYHLQSLTEASGFASPIFKVFSYPDLYLTRTITTCQKI